MRKHSAIHNGSIPGCAVYNNAWPCSIWWALRKPLQNVVIESGGVLENVAIAKHVFSCSARLLLKIGSRSQEQMLPRKPPLVFSFSARVKHFLELFNETFLTLSLFTYSSSLLLLLAGFLVWLNSLFSTVARFHWIAQCSSLSVFISICLNIFSLA